MAIRRRGRSRRGQRGAASQRLVLALAASALLTAAVSLPMAYQAHEARQQDDARAGTERVQVLGTTTVKLPDVRSDSLYWQIAPAEPQLLHRARVVGTPRIFVEVPGAVRADFRLDDGPVETDTTSPFELRDGEPVMLPPGAHSVTVTVTDGDGVSVLHQAFFTASG